jgi:molybdopterin-guanine dinucleotide biosynthesis protein
MPTIIAISGFSSNSGKTTLLCELLRAFPGWEAIKITRGHYRSCGKDPQACCVSDLLRDEPVIYSGREQTDAPGKDTGRYWEAGAANVHWVIATENQVEAGIKEALSRVQATGVLVEGTSFLKFIEAHFIALVARADGGPIKPSARRVLAMAHGLYLSGEADHLTARQKLTEWIANSPQPDLIEALPLYVHDDLPSLITHLQTIHALTQALTT